MTKPEHLSPSGSHEYEESAHDLATRIAATPGYSVLGVRRAWSAAVAWQVEAADRRTGERLLLLSEDQFDARPRAGESATVTAAASSCKGLAAAQVAPGL